MKRLKSISRLKKLNRHDIQSRDSAIVYINGEIIEAYSHAEAVREYQQRNDNDSVFRYDVYKNTDGNEQLAFAHKDDKTNSIFLETWTLKNVNVSEVVNAIKIKYPNYGIYEDDDDEDDEEFMLSNDPNDYRSLENKDNLDNLEKRLDEYNKIDNISNLNDTDYDILDLDNIYFNDDSLKLEIEEY